MLDVSYTPIVDHLNHSSISLSHTFQGISGISRCSHEAIYDREETEEPRVEGRKDGAKISEGAESEPRRRLYVRPATNGIVFYMVLSSPPGSSAVSLSLG